MNPLFLSGPLAQSIGWALLHLLWQGAIVAVILAAALALLAQRSANARYIAACAALALLPVLAVATAFRAYEAPVPSAVPSVEPLLHPESMPIDLARAAAAHVAESTLQSIGRRAQSALPDVVLLWLLGVTILSARLVVSWSRVRQLTHSSPAASAAWERVLENLSAALGLRRAVALLESASVEVPTVIGWLRPVIVLPASTLSGLAPEQIEMLLGHELAHIRRHDFLINLLQSFVETVMFYHPAVWWMSRRIRIEREHCCDDLAVDVCGNAVAYARALTCLEELRATRLGLAVAANGGSLIGRVRRLVAPPADSVSETPRWIAAVAALGVVITLLAIPSVPALAERESSQTPSATTAPPRRAHAEINVHATEAAPKAVDDAQTETGDQDSDAVDDDSDCATCADTAEALADATAASVDAALASDDTSLIPVIAPAAPAAPAPAPLPLPAPRAFAAPAAPPAPAAPALVPALRYYLSGSPVRVAAVAPRARVSRHIAMVDGKLSVDDLIALRAVGVTPEYIQSMRAELPDVTLDQLYSARAVGVTPEYLREAKAAGLGALSIDELVSMRGVGVDAAFVRDLRAAGVDVGDAGKAIRLRGVGVTPEYVREMKDAGLGALSTEDLVSLRGVGVTPGFVRDMRASGADVSSAGQAVQLRAVGVTTEYVAELAKAGYRKLSTSDLTMLRARGVDPAFIRSLADAGYTNLSVRELVRMSAAGINSEFIRDLAKYKEKTKDPAKDK